MIRRRRRDPIPKVGTPYSKGEAHALMAPLLGMDPADLLGAVLIGVDQTGAAGVAQTPGLTDATVLAIFETLAAHMRAEGVTPAT